MSYRVEAGLKRADLDESKPHIERWIARIRERPAYQRAVEKGGPVVAG